MHDYIKKNLDNTLIVLGVNNQKNKNDILIEAIDFSFKYAKHYKRESFGIALEKKANTLRHLVRKDILEKSNKARSVYKPHLIVVETMDEGVNKYKVEAVWTPLKQNYTVSLYFARR